MVKNNSTRVLSSLWISNYARIATPLQGLIIIGKIEGTCKILDSLFTPGRYSSLTLILTEALFGALSTNLNITGV